MGVHETVHKIFIHFKKAYGSVRREALYNILIEFGVPIKLRSYTDLNVFNWNS
jgi:hypothetical protein